MTINWTPSTACVGDLLPKGWKRNPRYSTPSTVDGLKKLLEQFGQYNRILVDENGIVDGHQRVAAWFKLHGKNFEALTNVADRPLTEKEREDFTLLNHAGGMGFWNLDELANWEPEALVLGGFDNDWLANLNQMQAFGIELLGEGFAEGEGENDPYEEWEGMPEFENEDNLGAHKSIKVHFATQEDVERFSSIIGQQITEGTKYIWFPKQEKENLKAYQAVNE